MNNNEQNITNSSITFIAPQLLNGGIVSDSPVTINQPSKSNENLGPSVHSFISDDNSQFSNINQNPVVYIDISNSDNSDQSTITKSEEDHHTPRNKKEDNDTTNSNATNLPPLNSNESINKARIIIWGEYLSSVRNDPDRIKEVKEHKMTFGDVTMKYGMKTIGQPTENGYPLFIALHGGGGSDSPDLNNSQWDHMSFYYLKGITNGIYLYPRGVRDTWDTHFNPESYPLYDRLITNMIAFYDVDPNRVYLTGYSAGGDGVYAIVARMADRFSASNMSAGHPNGVPLYNIYNMPIILQVGEFDKDYKRNITTAQYSKLLDNYQEEIGDGFIHKCFIHKQKPHNFYDNRIEKQNVIEDCNLWIETGESSTMNVDTNAIHLLECYIRNPIPKRVVWDLSQRADKRSVKSFYWLNCESDIRNGKIIASFDKDTNSIVVESCSVKGQISFLLNNDMLDLFAPITIKTPQRNGFVNVIPNYELLYDTTIERGDYNFQFVAKINMAFE